MFRPGHCSPARVPTKYPPKYVNSRQRLEGERDELVEGSNLASISGCRSRPPTLHYWTRRGRRRGPRQPLAGSCRTIVRSDSSWGSKHLYFPSGRRPFQRQPPEPLHRSGVACQLLKTSSSSTSHCFGRLRWPLTAENEINPDIRAN